jgi:hypothetical protein
LKRVLHAFQLVERPIWLVLLAGLLIRLLLMPFAAHSDLMHTYWDAHLIAYHQEFAVRLQMLLLYFHAGYLWLITPLLPHVDTLWIHLAEDWFQNPFLSSQVVLSQGWLDFISSPQVYRVLFLLKIPYLLFDLGCAYLLYLLGSNNTESKWMFTIWWLNPIVIFAVYAFGRHEVIALFFIVLSLYLLKRNKASWGILALGLAISVRYYGLFLLPLFVLSLQATWKTRAWRFLLGLTPWLIVNLLAWDSTGVTEAQSLVGIPHDSYLLSMKLPIAAWDNLYIFPFLFCLLLLHRLFNRAYGFRSLQRYSLIALLTLFATSYSGQSPQYWTWFIPFLAIGTAEDHRLLPLHVAQLACLFVYSFLGGRAVAGYLLASIAPDFFWSLPGPTELIGRSFSPEIAISLAHTAFSAITSWMIYLSFRSMPILFNDRV